MKIVSDGASCDMEEMYISIDMIEKTDKRLLRMLSYLWNGYNERYDSLLIDLRAEDGQQRMTVYADDEIIDSSKFTDSEPTTMNIEIRQLNGYAIMRERKDV